MAIYELTLDLSKCRVTIRHFGLFTTDDCIRMVEEFKAQALQLGGRPFTVLVDAREGQTLPPEGRTAIEELQRWAHARGLKRSAIVIKDPVMSLQYRRMVQRSGIQFLEAQFETIEEAEAYLDEA
jgi:hypothetical protein